MDTLKYATPAALMQASCDAVRERDGTSELIPHQDLPERIRAIPAGTDTDFSVVTARPENVAETVEFLDAEGVLRPGTMPEIPAETVTLDTETMSYPIAEGHHTGNGSVQILTETVTMVPTKDGYTLLPTSGKVIGKVILDPIPDIYADISGADAAASQVLDGSKFVGENGALEEGTMPNNGAVAESVTSNGTYSVSRGYHNGNGYYSVNVPQTVAGEDSTDCTAAAADVRYPKTFRSGGYFWTGSMEDVAIPSPDISIDYTNGKITAKNTVQYAGYMAKGEESASLTLPVFTGGTFTPGSSEQTLETNGCLVNGDIIIGAAPQMVMTDITPTVAQNDSYVMQIRIPGAAATYGAAYIAADVNSGRYTGNAGNYEYRLVGAYCYYDYAVVESSVHIRWHAILTYDSLYSGAYSGSFVRHLVHTAQTVSFPISMTDIDNEDDEMRIYLDKDGDDLLLYSVGDMITVYETYTGRLVGRQ